MANTDADVIIAGAGPAGSMAAYELARSGVRVLLLEKSAFPRYKVCGGGLTHKIIKEIPFDITEIIETVIHTIRFSSKFQDVFSRTSPEPLMYCTMRSKLDHYLLEKAIQAGAKVQFLQQVTEVKNEYDTICVFTKGGCFRSRLIIGADGPSSIVARSLGLRLNIEQGLAWEAEITTVPEMLKMYSDTVFLDWGTFPGGYGWVFPKNDHFSIGVGGPAGLSKQMMPYYKKFLEYLDFGGSWQSEIGSQQYCHCEKRSDEATAVSSQQSAELSLQAKRSNSSQHPVIQSLKSWPIPVKSKKGKFHSGNALLVGDAAGLTDSFTGEGIYYAIRSGKLAAAACASSLQGQADALKMFNDQVNDELMSELLEGKKIKHIFNTVPLKIHCFVRDNDRAWRAFGKVLRGDRSYKDVKLGFGNWKSLWNLAGFISGYIEKMKTFRYKKWDIKRNKINE
jgi:geranylgeranyl reductase family protein